MNTILEKGNERKMTEWERYEDMRKFFDKNNQILLFENICYFDSSNNSIVLRDNSHKNIQTYQNMNEVYMNHLRERLEILNLKSSPLFEIISNKENDKPIIISCELKNVGKVLCEIIKDDVKKTINDSEIFDGFLLEDDGEIEEDLILSEKEEVKSN